MKSSRFLFHLLVTLLLATGYSINAMQDHIIDIPGIIGENEPAVQLVPVIPDNNNLVQIDPEQRITSEEGTQKNIRIVQQIQAAKALAAKRKTAYESAYQESPQGSQFEQKGLYAQYAAAPDYHSEMQRIHKQHNNLTPVTQMPSHPSIPSTRHNVYSPNTKTTAKVKKYDPMFAVVTTAPEVLKIIRDYAFEPEKLLELIQEFSIKTNTYANETLVQMTMSTNDTEDDACLIAARHYPPQIYLRTIEGERPNQHFPYICDDLRPSDQDCCAKACTIALFPPFYLLPCSYGLVAMLIPCATPPVLLSGWVSLIVASLGCFTTLCQKCCEPNDINQPRIRTDTMSLDTEKILTNDRGYLQIWNKNGRLQRTINAHTDNITALTTTLHGAIITGSKDTTAKIWNNTFKNPIILPHGAPIDSITAYNNGIATISPFRIKLWKHDGSILKTIDHEDYRIYKVCADGTIIFSQYSEVMSASEKTKQNIPDNCCVLSHYDPVTDHTLKKQIIPARRHELEEVICIEQLSDGTILGVRYNKTMLFWKTNNTITNFDHASARYYSHIVSIHTLKNGGFVVARSSNFITFFLPDDAAIKLLDQCTIEQLVFIKDLLDHTKLLRPYEIITLHDNTREQELFLSLPAYIRGALRSHCPKLQLSTSCCSSIGLCSKKNQ